ncbi:SoxR-reducing system protein RseC [Candidatus Symbiopectobacterium sp. NZEC135]|uniref:SoxR-reducing system protein RseC n=1 Tax=Candidatus Symbiopectobacterium sp. NZEC135 TaxID=2820471 RepID=UPI002226E245|nr:SoxR-reducing system protein RseC [Candidatus Symbiopectobacterium sp. NZEC135]MCW2481249.1 SoxR-reducing system protein RseC [Candidatus Symbiopectobacterium sp. NZEC135]
MIKEWATVVSWHNGMAELHCEQRSGCSGCQSRKTCGTGLLSELGRSAEQALYVPCEQPLLPGQRVELGISESSLLRSAMLVYLVPLLGLFTGAGLLQSLFANDLAAVLGALLGAALAFILVRGWSLKLGEKRHYRPVILQIALPGQPLHIES